ncbi:MAG: hypothetical protein V4687_06770 [Bacteroidota bacterium]
MSKINVIGNGFVQVDNTLYNLRNYLTVEKYTYGYDEAQGTAYGIRLTPPHADKVSYENGVAGSFFLSTYSENEKEQFEDDFYLLITALEHKQKRVHSFAIVYEVTERNHIITTPFEFDGSTVRVYIDGLRQSFGFDFNYLSNNEIVILDPFSAGTKFIIED